MPQLAAYARRLRVIAITDAGYLAQFQQVTALAQSAGSPQDVVDHVQEQLSGLLGLEQARFEFGSLLSHPPRLAPDGSLTTGQGRWDVDKAGLPGEFELRVSVGRQYYGAVSAHAAAGSKPSLQARLVAVSLADLARRASSAAEVTRSAR